MDKYNTLCSLIEQANILAKEIDFKTTIDSLNLSIETLTNTNIKLNETNDLLNKEVKELNFRYNKDMELLSNELKNKQEDLVNLTKVSYIQSLNKQVLEKNNYILILESQLDKLRLQNSSNQTAIIDKRAKIAADAAAQIAADAAAQIAADAAAQIAADAAAQIASDAAAQIASDAAAQIAENEEELIEEKSIKSKKSKKQVIDDDTDEENHIVENYVVEEKPKKRKKSKQQNNEDKFDPETFEDINGYELLVYKNKYYLRDLETSELYDIVNNKPNHIVGLINSKSKVKFN